MKTKFECMLVQGYDAKKFCICNRDSSGGDDDTNFNIHGNANAVANFVIATVLKAIHVVVIPYKLLVVLMIKTILTAVLLLANRRVTVVVVVMVVVDLLKKARVIMLLLLTFMIVL